jgi:tetratricopeptide (TPR) repeat protein
MKIRLVSSFLMVAGLGPLMAQDPVGQRVVASLDLKLVDPACDLPGGGDFRIRSGRTYLSTGISGTGAPENRVRAIREGIRVITDAITGADQAKNPAAWYYLGRLYLQQGNLVGADSAFARAEALAPQCKTDIMSYRTRPWAGLVNQAATFAKANQNDSAIVMYRAANQILRTQPHALFGLAQAFNQQGAKDSALSYFALAAATEPTDANSIKLRNESLFDQGVMLLNAGRSADAVPVLQRYVQLEPADSDGQKALSRARVGSASGDSASVASLSEDELSDLAAKQYNDKNYAAAATTSGRVAELNPFSRDALYIQANSYIALRQWDKLGPVAEKLCAIEPLSHFEHSMLVQAYKAAGDQAKLADAVIAGEAIVSDVDIRESRITADGASVDAVATGREARDKTGKVIPSRALTLVFEFVDKTGSVVTTQEVALPQLAKGATQSISVQAKGQGIKGWRYKVR